MRLRDAVFAGGITWLALFGAYLAASRYAALQLRTHFFAASPFEWIRTTAEHQQATDHGKNR